MKLDASIQALAFRGGDEVSLCRHNVESDGRGIFCGKRVQAARCVRSPSALSGNGTGFVQSLCQPQFTITAMLMNEYLRKRAWKADSEGDDMPHNAQWSRPY